MQRIIAFLRQLAANNNREWFAAHKAEYQACKAEFDRFVEQLVAAVRGFDDSIPALTPADCTYRIYRDTRFSKNKDPYKTHFGAFICPGGKKSPFSGYYVQVGPDDNGFDSGCVLATGNYCVDPKVLKILREDIELDRGEAFDKAVDSASGFRLDLDGSLKRCPRGFPADQPYSHWFLLKNYCLVSHVGVNYFLRPALINRLTDDLQKTKPFLDLINRAVEYSLDNN